MCGYISVAEISTILEFIGVFKVATFTGWDVCLVVSLCLCMKKEEHRL